MRKFILIFLGFFLVPGFVSAQKIISIKIDGTINPVTAGFIERGIEKAEKENAECLIIHLNTPGGLLKSTRVIVSNILTAEIPVVVYVSPGGAHAGSAGVFITLAAHIAAMAPGTNIGAAHPVSLQGGMDSTMSDKATNDAAAFIRSIAEKRKRNLEWAEDAVRKSYSITENEALEKNVIDMVSKNQKELLASIHGKVVEVNSGNATINAVNAQIEEIEMTLAERLLNMFSDPNIAYILLLLGIYGVLFELYNPGVILPGIVGGICLILAFYSMHTLPINYAGLALILFAIILFILEIKVVSHGLLAIGGVVSLLLGSIMLIKPDSPLELARISRGVIIPAVIITAAFFLFIVGMGLRAQRLKTVTGEEGMVGKVGEAIEDFEGEGRIMVHGEYWDAEILSGKISAGDKVRVIDIKNMKLIIEPFNNQS